jgi:hypothetical protein
VGDLISFEDQNGYSDSKVKVVNINAHNGCPDIEVPPGRDYGWTGVNGKPNWFVSKSNITYIYPKKKDKQVVFAKKPTKKLGIDTTKHQFFRVMDAKPNNKFVRKGDIVEFDKEDGSLCPWFKHYNHDTRKMDRSPLYWVGLTYSKETSIKVPAPLVKPDIDTCISLLYNLDKEQLKTVASKAIELI